MKCRSCGETIWFVETKTGRKMPMCRCPRCKGEGHMRRVDPATGVIDETRVCPFCKGSGEVTHFATCPQSRAWSRKAVGGGPDYGEEPSG